MYTGYVRKNNSRYWAAHQGKKLSDRTPYDSNSDDRMCAKIRRKETLSGSNKLIEEYLSHMQKKGFLIYHEETRLYIPTDKGMHFLKIYNMLASLLI